MTETDGLFLGFQKDGLKRHFLSSGPQESIYDHDNDLFDRCEEVLKHIVVLLELGHLDGGIITFVLNILILEVLPVHGFLLIDELHILKQDCEVPD